MVATNDTYRLAPWADVLHACDEKWWEVHLGVPEFAGLKFSLQNGARQWPGVQVIGAQGDRGLSADPSEVTTGKNSGHQAINIAVHLGAKRIVLLGYDMQAREGAPSHFFGEHPKPLKAMPAFAYCISCFESLVQPLALLGVEIVNCTRETALTCFPRQPLEAVL